jgi:Protein of unknown function (DUF1648)
VSINGLIGLYFGVFAGTVAYTAFRYRELPDRIPLHFGITGRADWLGPRPLVWLLVGIQALVVVPYSLGVFSFTGREPLVGLLAVTLTAWLQIEVVNASINGTNRTPPARLWTVLAVFLIAVISTVAIR